LKISKKGFLFLFIFAIPLLFSSIEVLFGVSAKVDLVNASEDILLGKYEKSNRSFEKYEIGNLLVYFHQRRIENAIVEGDYIRYKFNKTTGKLLKGEIGKEEIGDVHIFA